MIASKVSSFIVMVSLISFINSVACSASEDGANKGTPAAGWLKLSESVGSVEHSVITGKDLQPSRITTGSDSRAEFRHECTTVRLGDKTDAALSPENRMVYLMQGEMLLSCTGKGGNTSALTRDLQIRAKDACVLVQVLPGGISRVTPLSGSVTILDRHDRSLLSMKPGVVYELRDKHAPDFIVGSDEYFLQGQSPIVLYDTPRSRTRLHCVSAERIQNHPLIKGFQIGLNNQSAMEACLSKLPAFCFESKNSGLPILSWTDPFFEITRSRTSPSEPTIGWTPVTNILKPDFEKVQMQDFHFGKSIGNGTAFVTPAAEVLSHSQANERTERRNAGAIGKEEAGTLIGSKVRILRVPNGKYELGEGIGKIVSISSSVLYDSPPIAGAGRIAIGDVNGDGVAGLVSNPAGNRFSTGAILSAGSTIRALTQYSNLSGVGSAGNISGIWGASGALSTVPSSNFSGSRPGAPLGALGSNVGGGSNIPGVGSGNNVPSGGANLPGGFTSNNLHGFGPGSFPGAFTGRR